MVEKNDENSPQPNPRLARHLRMRQAARASKRVAPPPPEQTPQEPVSQGGSRGGALQRELDDPQREE
jgi:hypothetical protein